VQGRWGGGGVPSLDGFSSGLLDGRIDGLTQHARQVDRGHLRASEASTELTACTREAGVSGLG
jgi:hypothetical protein